MPTAQVNALYVSQSINYYLSLLFAFGKCLHNWWGTECMWCKFVVMVILQILFL